MAELVPRAGLQPVAGPAGLTLRVLCVAPLLPYPPNHGLRVRTWHLLRGLAHAAEVTLLTWAPEHEPAEHLEAVRHTVAELVVLPTLPIKRRPGRRVMRQLGFLAGGLPPYVQALLDERALGRAAQRSALVGSLAAGRPTPPFDLVVYEEEAMRALPLGDLGAPLVVHRLEAFGRALAEVRQASLGGRLQYRLDGRRWWQFDRTVMEDVSLVVATSPESVAELRPICPDVPFVIVPNGVELRSLRTPPEEGRDIAFIGTMDYPPNVDGIVWFVSELWPQLRERFPDSRLRLVGRNPSKVIRDLAGAGVEVTGEVHDLAEACEGVRVGVVPLRSGMGIKNKTLDFMSMGIPVVTTPAGAEGVAAEPAHGMLRCDVGPRFAEVVATLLSDGAQVARLGRAARDYVASHHSWEAIGREYQADLMAVAGGDAGAGGRAPGRDGRAPR